jgi:mono/diheme cytochrome c family protein
VITKTLAVVTVAAALLSASAFAQTAAETYKSKCQMCHADDGSGNTPAGKALKTTPFSDEAVIKASDADLIAATKNGKGKMPAYSGKLTDPQIKELIAYIRTLQKK